MRKVKGKKKNKRPEYVVICREVNQEQSQAAVYVIDSAVTNHLINNLTQLSHQ